MKCIDWQCGKSECSLYARHHNPFTYTMCRNCSDKLKTQLCKTCGFGQQINSKTLINTYLCKKDNTIGFQVDN